jgi:hypothetical protein
MAGDRFLYYLTQNSGELELTYPTKGDRNSSSKTQAIASPQP